MISRARKINTALRAAMGTRPTLMATTRPTRSSSSSNSSSTRSSSILPHTWGRKDEPTLNKAGGGPWHTESSKSNLIGTFSQSSSYLGNPRVMPRNDKQTTRSSSINQLCQDLNASPMFHPQSRGFSAPTSSRHFHNNNNVNNNNNNNNSDKDIKFYGPSPVSAVGTRERFQPGVNSPRRQANSIMYAELQLPRASANTNTTRGRRLQRSGGRGEVNNSDAGRLGEGVVASLGKNPGRTQYAEITFQRENLQSAHI